MGKDPKYGIGLFDDGVCLQMVCLTKDKGQIKVVSAETFQLERQFETVNAGNNLILEAVGGNGDEPERLTLTDDLLDDTALFTADNGTKNNDYIKNISDFLNNYSDKSFKIAITLTEPDIFYSFFKKSQLTKNSSLKKQIFSELSKVEHQAETITEDNYSVLPLEDERVMAIVKNSELPIIDHLETAKTNCTKKLSFIETAEISLLNLIKKNYDLLNDEISVVVYVGSEYSRLIFLRGTELFHISHVIGVDYDAPNICNTIFSRLLLEQDNLNLTKLNNIILAGEVFDSGLREFMVERMPEEIIIDYLNFKNLGVMGIDPLLSRFAVTFGVAFRIFEANSADLYKIDLTPAAIIDKKKMFKLGIPGWIMLFLIPLFTFFGTVRNVQRSAEMADLDNKIRHLETEFRQLQDFETEFNSLNTKLENYQKTITILDSITTGSKTWSIFLKKMAFATKKIGGIWIVQIDEGPQGKLKVSGYSLFRERIPRFVNQFRKTTLNLVEVQEIRERRVYHFELEIRLPEKKGREN